MIFSLPLQQPFKRGHGPTAFREEFEKGRRTDEVKERGVRSHRERQRREMRDSSCAQTKGQETKY